jgi:hypothetical protein
MISRAIGFCLMPVDNRTCFIMCFIVVHSIRPACRVEIMFAANRFNRISVSFPGERNSGMDGGDRAGRCWKALSIGIYRSRPCEAEEKQRHQDRLTTQHFQICIGGMRPTLAPMHEPRAKIVRRQDVIRAQVRTG